MQFSIIVPVYNTAKYLPRCLNSILDQSIADWECILVNDGSTDDSGMICDDYATRDSRYKVIHKPNGGASSARNAGLDLASGIWVSFIDSDDWVTNDYLQTFIENNNNADITFFAVSQEFQNGDAVIRKPEKFYGTGRNEIEETFASLKHGHLGDILGWTVDKFYRLNFLKENNIRFCENLVFREDEIFIMEAGRFAQSVAVLDSVLYHYCCRDNGLTSNGIQLGDYKVLSDKLLEVLPYYHNKTLLSKDYSRVAEYKIKYALLKGSLKTSFKYVKWLYSYFKNCSGGYSLGRLYKILAPRNIPSFVMAVLLFVPIQWVEERRH